MGRDDESLVRIAHALRERRIELGITQSDLADILGVTPAYLSALETARFTTQTRRLAETLSSLGLELIALPRDHPVVAEQRMHSAASPRRRGDRESPDARRLRDVLASVDLSKIENPRMADRLGRLKGLAEELGVEFSTSSRVAHLLEPLRALEVVAGVDELVGGETGRVLEAVWRYLEGRNL